jgi:serine/threonine-protein kinase
MKPDPAAEEALIGSLADGTPIDWAALEADARDEPTRRRYRNLRLVARIAELHRTLTMDEADEADARGDIREPPAVWGRLSVAERLASGAFGDLYRAHDTQLDRDVALKLLRARAEGTATARLLSEARTLARVSHPNVVIVHGADVCDGQPGLWMELIDGQTLAAAVDERGRFGAGEAIAIGRDLCRALSAVHGAGLVHGDVKAQNVMREVGGRIVLMDFGAGRAQGTRFLVQGTPLYLAPEVLAGAPPTPASDIYSLGVLLFGLLTERYPYEAEDLDGLRQAHADGTRLHLRDLRPDLPHALVDGIERALDPDPARRFTTPGALDAALAAAETIAVPWWRTPLAAAMVLAAAIVAAAVVWPRGADVRPIRSLAVLSFGTLGAETAHLFDGLARDVVRELQRFDLQVRTTFGATALATAAGVDARLRVDAIVDASATTVSTGPVLDVSLRRAGAAPFWTRRYPVRQPETAALATTIAHDIAASVGAALRAGSAPIYQPNQKAYDAYLQGRWHAQRRNLTDLNRSLAYFTQALALDSRYAEAWAGMADAYLALGVPPFGDLRPMEARRLARKAADAALAINPDLVEAVTTLAWSAALYDWDWAGAEAGFRRAIGLNPQYALARHWYAMFLTDMGRFDEALSELAQAQAIEPLSPLIHRDFAWIYFMAGRNDDAVAQLRETLANEQNYGPARTLLARALAAQGDFAEARAELERARPGIGEGSYLSFRGYIEAAAGDPAAVATLAALRRVAAQEYVTPYYFALIHAARGDHDQAILDLQRAHAEQDATLGSVNVDPRFDALRSDARFQALTASMRFPNRRR